MPQIVSCPDCGRKLKIPDDLLGKRVKCPGCGEKYLSAADEPDDADEEAPAPRSESVISRREAPARPRGRTIDEDEDDDRPKSRRRDDEEEEDEDYPVTKRRRGDLDDDARPEPSKADVRVGWERVRLGINLIIIGMWILVGMIVAGGIGYMLLAVFVGTSIGSMATTNVGGGPMSQQQASQMAGQAAGTMGAALIVGCLLYALLGLLGLAYVVLRLTGMGFCMAIAPTRKTQTLKALAIAAFSVACAALVLPFLSAGVGAVLARSGAGGCLLSGGYGLGGILALAEIVCFVLFLRGVAVVMKKDGLAQSLVFYLIGILVYILLVPIALVVLFLGGAATMIGVASTAHNASAAAGNASGAVAAMFVGGLICFGVVAIAGLGLFIWYMILLHQVRAAVDGWLHRN